VIFVGEKLLSLKQVAEWLSVSERTIHNMLERGELRGVQIGNRACPSRQRPAQRQSED
jgi:excisionase family DNA binding protein